MLAPPVKSGPRFDEMIQSDKVRVIDENGENLGVMYTNEAIEQANEIGLNLVEVSPNAENRRYLETKKSKLGHRLHHQDLRYEVENAQDD